MTVYLCGGYAHMRLVARGIQIKVSGDVELDGGWLKGISTDTGTKLLSTLRSTRACNH